MYEGSAILYSYLSPQAVYFPSSKKNNMRNAKTQGLASIPSQVTPIFFLFYFEVVFTLVDMKKAV